MEMESGSMETREEGSKLGLGFPYWIPSRRRFKPDDLFFAAGNTERELLAKHVALDLTEDERYQLQKMEVAGANTVFCPIAGCGARLDYLEDFEDHYRTRHTASCSVCFRVYPTSRLLSIHVSEAHDSFFQAKVARGYPMYECLVESCGVKLKSYKSRQQHLVDKHKFPTTFEFYKKARPSKHRREKNQRKQALYKSEETKEKYMDVDEKTQKKMHQIYKPKQPKEAKETEMEVEEKIDDLVSAVSKLSTSDSSPSSVSFGHRHARGFAFVPRSIRQSRKQVSQPEAQG
ncbi:zinc finger protein 511 [Ananas comosus]|uniref:Zinc finger protein 511 n=1 Tax=Ananas comosus TaxID=4615 RepID=A0A6P5GCT9_ANACO|nr:zinc finger protein 511 [Ananas comosus]XP_020106417.1 zinc finger protein 511 [Ananas comosus]